MECEFVQKQLALNEITPELHDRINAHLASCLRCRRAASMYAGMREALAGEPVWRPPTGFALRVADAAAPVFLTPRIRSRFTAVAAIAAALLLLVGYWVKGALLQMFATAFEGYVSLVNIVSRAFVMNAAFLLWIFAGISIIVTVWLTRRSLAGG